MAADYGAPTTRKRFFLIARCDRRPIVWPEPTHAPADSTEVIAGTKKPWRSAAEIIDWTLPCPSIFDTREQVREKYGLNAQRPLRPNTMRRVARGVDKFVIKTANPFLVIVNHAGEFRGQGLGEPLQTITAKHGYGVVSPVMAPATLTNTTGSAGAPASDPVHTVTSAGNQALTEAVLAPLTMHNNENAVGTAITAPINTITGSGAGGHQMLITPTLAAIDWDGNNFIRTYFQKVDKPGNKRLIQSIVDSQNIIGNGYVARDYCAGYRVEFRSDENPVTNLLNGHLTTHTFLAPYIPAEYIENIREYDVDALQAAFGGN